METVIVTLEVQINEDPNEWDPASMGLPFLDSDPGWDDPQHRAHAIASMILQAVEQNVMVHDGHYPFGDVLGYYADTSSENPHWQVRWNMIEVGNMGSLEYRVGNVGNPNGHGL